MKIRKIIMILVALLMLMITSSLPVGKTSGQVTQDDYHFIRSWGGESDQIRYPRGININSNNDIFVVNIGKMTVIDQETRTYQVWNDFFETTTLGVFLEPTIAFDNFGFIYYPLNSQIQKFTPEGVLLGSWGGLGSNPGQFNQPHSVAIDSAGFIYVADTGNYRIQKFTADMSFITQWTKEKFGFDSFTPTAIGIDNENYLYVVDGKKVIKMSSDGQLIRIIGEGFISTPVGVALSSDKKVYILDQYLQKVFIFNQTGQLLGELGSTAGSEPGQFQWPEGIAIDNYDNIFVSDTFNHRLQKIDQYGNVLNIWGTKISTLGEFTSPTGMALDNNKILLIVDSRNDRIQRFTKDGTFIESWGNSGYALGQFKTPMDVAVDQYSYVYVADHDIGRIQKLNSIGQPILSWSLGEISFPMSIGINRNLQRIYITENGNDRVVVYNYQGQFLFSWGIRGSDNGQFFRPKGLTIDDNGYVYVVDGLNHRIQKFDSQGNFVITWGYHGYDEGLLNYPSDIAWDDSGYLYVTDSSNQRIQKFDTEGNFISTWGTLGRQPGQFIVPYGITTDGEGKIFVSDGASNQIHVYDIVVPDPDSYSGLVLNGSFNNENLNWTVGGDLPVSFPQILSPIDTSLLLGRQVEQESQGMNQAWSHQTIFVDPSWSRPTLSFKYNMFVNDIMDYSDFFVAIQDGVGLNHLATVVRDGFQPCIPGVAPSPGRDLGWRSVTYDLSAYKGQHIRLVFSNRNLWPGSWGIWTYVDDVRVIDAGPLPPMLGPYFSFLPLINNYRCDPVLLNAVSNIENVELRNVP